MENTTGPAAATSRRGFLRLAGVIGAAATVAGTVAACGGENPNKRTAGQTGQTGGAKQDGTIVAGISYELGTNGYDPMSTSAALTVAANWHTLEGLTEILPAADRQVYAALGADLPTKIDETTYEVSLREGAVFHDGSPVTTDDVVFSFERVLDPKNASLYASFVPFIDSVTAKDDKTVSIRLKYAFSLINERLAVVKIVPKAAVEADPKAFDANPVGTGPYKMTDNGAATKSIKFERFADYKGPYPAKAAAMEWKILPDDSTRTNGLQSRTVQAIDSVPYLSIKTIESTAKVESVQGFGLLFAMFNNGSAPFDNVKNRQAVMYALDMDKIIQTALLGNATAATCFVPEDHPAYKKASTVYAFDAAKAKSLLGETGLTKIRMLCTDHSWVKQATPIMKESLEAVGLQVEFAEKKSADVYTTIDGQGGSYDLVIAPGDPSVFGNDADLLLRWWYANDVWTDTRMHWKSTNAYATVQDLLAKAVEATGDEQKTVWGQIFDAISDDVPLYPLFHRKAPTAWDSTSLVDFAPISLTGLSFLGAASTK
ncbi:MAG: ABC transporter substrate-binding protein [Propionibacteriales bacterium]|nr:ABC transporter substrate-binding protein [Propionibacteriales bacterium]